MPVNRYGKAKQFLEEIQKEHGNLVPFSFFLTEIRKKIGAHETKTVKPYLRLMQETNLIKGDEDRIIIL